eukprot:3751242-Rhodomonas_salina.3
MSWTKNSAHSLRSRTRLGFVPDWDDESERGREKIQAVNKLHKHARLCGPIPRCHMSYSIEIESDPRYVLEEVRVRRLSRPLLVAPYWFENAAELKVGAIAHKIGKQF